MAEFLGAVLVISCLASTEVRGATSGQVWSDPYSGFAIGGYDPIAYFTEGRAVPGSDEHEYSWRGVTWRFANSGNLAAFRDHPLVYVPQFGGYGALSIAKGYTGPGNPNIWEIRDRRLYLFFSIEEREEWQKDADTWIARADANWPRLRQTLPF